MSPRKKRARHVGCALDRTPGGILRFRFWWRFPGEETFRRFAETTACDDTPKNRVLLEQVRREIGAAIKRGTFDYPRVFPTGRHVHRFTPARADEDGAAEETVASYYERWLLRKLGSVAATTFRDYKQHLGRYVVPRTGSLPPHSRCKGND
jgi:hypothetical protein